MKNITVSIKGMACDHCAQSIDKKFKDKEGILFRQISYPSASGKFENEKIISVNGMERYTALKFLISTGASTHIPKIKGLKESGYLTHATLFDVKKKPESITIFGAGYIGLEIAMVYNRLGIKVRIIEFSERVLRSQTPDVSEVLQKQLISEGIKLTAIAFGKDVSKLSCCAS